VHRIDRVVLAEAISWFGLWVHELHRVPGLFGFTPDGDLFTLPIAAALATWWVRSHSAAALIALAAYAAINLVGGVLSALPLGWLPFVPEQTAAHYVVHVVYAGCQLPLLTLVLARIRAWPRGTEERSESVQ
jgi:hypothetical protein